MIAPAEQRKAQVGLCATGFVQGGSAQGDARSKRRRRRRLWRTKAAFSIGGATVRNGALGRHTDRRCADKGAYVRRRRRHGGRLAAGLASKLRESGRKMSTHERKLGWPVAREPRAQRVRAFQPHIAPCPILRTACLSGCRARMQKGTACSEETAAATCVDC